MDKFRVTVLVTDLDNTLFDWVEIWYQSFNAMLTKLVEESHLERSLLEREFLAIHQKHGTAEYAFAIEELPSLRALHPGEDLAKRYGNAIAAYREARSAALRLYPGTMETLKNIKGAGTLVVGYTESMAYYSNYRLRRLGLDGVLDYLYSPEDHDLPIGMTADQIRTYPAEHYRLHRTIHRHTPKGVLKPNPDVLLKIVRDVHASAGEAVYVGDNLVKDVAMAKEAGIVDVHAAYGVAHNRESYELLRRVTHWTPEMVERERRATVQEIQPMYTLRRGFAELEELFAFASIRA